MNKLIYVILFILLCSFVSAGELTDPWAYFSFNTTDATAYYDDYGKYDNIKLVNYTTTRVSNKCIIPPCVSMNGATDHNLRAEDPLKNWQNTTTIGSASIWVNTSDSGLSLLIGNYLTSGDYFLITIHDSDGGLFIDFKEFDARGYAWDKTGRDLSDGEWHHIVITGRSEGLGWDAYVDGVNITGDLTLTDGNNLKGAWFGELTYTTPSTKTQLGGARQGAFGNYFMDGELDEVALYDFVLTGPQVNCTVDNTSQVCQLWRDGRGWNPLSNVSTTENFTAAVNITPSLPVNNTDQLTGFCNITSTLGVGNSVTLQYQWYQNSILDTSGEVYGVSGTNYNTSTILASSLACYDNWLFKCRGYNETYGAWSETTVNVSCTTNTTAFVRTLNVLTGSYVSANYTIRNSTGHLVWAINDSGVGYVQATLGDGDNYTISGSASGNVATNQTISIPSGQTRYVTLLVSFNVEANIYDEALSGVGGTNVAFDVTVPESVDFIVTCEDDSETIIEDVSTNPYPFGLNCSFRKFGFLVTYAGEDAASYYRRYIEDPILLNSTGSFNAYLVDAINFTVLQIIFKIVDFSNDYDDLSVHVKKVINDELVVISADYVGVDNTVTAYLLANEEYIVEIHSDNYPVIVSGYYTPVVSEVKYLGLLDLKLLGTPSGVSAVEYAAWASNSTGNVTAYLYYNDSDTLTTQLNWSLHLNDTSNSLIYSILSSSNNVILSKDINVYENKTVVSWLQITRTPPLPDYIKTIYYGNETKVPLPIRGYYSQKVIDWAITILLGVVLLTATTGTALYVALVVSALAVFFSVIGWYGLSPVYPVLALLLSAIRVMRSGVKK